MFSMTTSHALVHAKNSTLNAKGADAWKSTLEPLIDLFTIGIKRCPTDFDEFEKIFQIVSKALKYDPLTFLKIIKLHRLIKNGNGIKWLYYLAMCIIKFENESAFELTLQWSWAYPKDILTLHRLTNMYEPITAITKEKISLDNIGSHPGPIGSFSNKINAFRLQNKILDEIPLQFEIVFYTENVFKIFKNLLTPNFKGEINPMFLKYMSYQTGHWAVESKLIWTYLKELIKTDSFFITLVNSEEPLSNDIGTELRSILKNSNPIAEITNKTCRLIKKCFNQHINLLDNLFKGFHSDGKEFGSLKSEEAEIRLITNQIKRSATLAFDRFEKTVKKYSRSETPLVENTQKALVKSYLSKGYLKYLELLKSGKAVAKTTGLDVSQQVWDFFISNNEFDQSLESKLIELSNDLKVSLIKVTEEEILETLASKFELVLDISDSMNGTPIQTGLLYMLLIAKTFHIKKLYYFESDLHIVNLTSEDFNKTMCNLIKKVYKQVTGSTNLQAVFTHFKKSNLRDRNVIIITDGDCDPVNNTSNPFHSAPKEDFGINYIVVNVKETKMNFPYLGLDPNVCYVTGNNPKTLNGLIRALVVSLITKVQITPSLVLKYSLDLDELNCNIPIETFSKDFRDSEILKLFDVFMVNFPNTKGVNNNYDPDSNYPDDSDSDSN